MKGSQRWKLTGTNITEKKKKQTLAVHFCPHCSLPRDGLGLLSVGPSLHPLRERGVRPTQTIKAPACLLNCIAVRTQRPTQTVTVQVTLRSAVLCVFTSVSADVRQMEPEAQQGPHSRCRAQRIPASGLANGKENQRSTFHPLISPDGLWLDLLISPHLFFFYL